MTVFASNACADFIVPFGARAINASRSSAFSFDASAKTSFGVTALRTSSKKPFWIMTIFRCRRLLLLPNDDDDDDDDFGGTLFWNAPPRSWQFFAEKKEQHPAARPPPRSSKVDGDEVVIFMSR